MSLDLRLDVDETTLYLPSLIDHLVTIFSGLNIGLLPVALISTAAFFSWSDTNWAAAGSIDTDLCILSLLGRSTLASHAAPTCRLLHSH